MNRLYLALPVLMVCSCTTMVSDRGEEPLPSLPQHLLLSRTPGESAAFYSKVFGWGVPRYRTSNTYALTADSTVIGGMIGLPEDLSTEQQAMWLVAIQTTDLEEALTQVNAHGGKVVHGPSTVRGDQRTAVVEDPQGGVFQIVEGALEQPDCWVWAELAAEEPAVSAAWYSKVFGVEEEPAKDGRVLLTQQGTAIAAVSPTVFDSSRNQWVPVLAVNGLSGHLKKVEGAQGEILLSSEADGVALMLDPQGAPLLLQEQEVAQ